MGVIAFITVIGAALAWSVWRRQLAPAPSAAVAAGRFWNGPSAAVAVAVLVAVGCASFAVDSAGHAAVGIIAPFARAALPGGGVPIPPPPPEYAFYVGMSGQAIAVVFERLITTTTTGGVTLCLVLIGLSVMSAALLPRGPVSRAGGLAAQAVAVTLVVSAGWYCVQLGAVVGWLGAVVRTIS